MTNLNMNFGSGFWDSYWSKLQAMAEGFDYSYIAEFLLYFLSFYLVFKILKDNKGSKGIALIIGATLGLGLAVSLSDTIPTYVLIATVAIFDICVLLLYETELKRLLLGSGAKKHTKKDSMTVSDVEFIIDEIIHAVQHMSKQDVGALIVLSNENLPEGIISSGTVINANINTAMIEAVFYPKAPLHDGAMIIEGDKIHAAGCFLPLIQNDNLPQEVGSRHRAALGVTTVASVTSIVVSEETGVISIVRDGEVKKKYASDTDLKKALSDYYWIDLSGEGAKSDEKNR